MATDFRILGPLEVVENGGPIDLGGQKQRALLAMLLLHPNVVVSTDRLIDAVWEDAPPARADKALQVYISQIRKAIGKERLTTASPGYRLAVGEDELDAARFERLLAEGKPNEALALWRGPALGDFAYARFAATEIARLEELRLSAVEARIERDLAEGRHAEVAGELEGLVREHPLRERLRGQLMLALYRAGRQAEALEAYQDARRALSEELGLEPSRELRELQQAILNQDPALDDTTGTGGRVEPQRGIFVGRQQELTELLAGLDETLAGHGRLFLLRGEPGIGKSRLADEVMAQARSRGAQVLVGRSWEAGGAPAYWPWVQALRGYIERATAEALRSELGGQGSYLAQLLPELRELLPELSEPPALESESARFRLFEAALLFLRRAAAARPIVLVLDDLHAADEPSLLLLQFVARELADSRLLVIGAYRDVDPTLAEPLTAALVEFGREPTTRTIALTGLDESDVERFIELTTTNDAAAAELAVTVHAETEGNPLFVGEIVRLLAAEGKLLGHAPLAIPQSVRDVIIRRLRHLSDECNRVLLLASVLGREFDLNALAELASVSENQLLETLDEAMTTRVVSDVPDSPRRLRFAHVLIRDALYEGLTTARRVRLHRLAVEALEALYGDEPGPHMAELAHHAVAGSEFHKGLQYARTAGDRAVALVAYEEAARHYQAALDAGELAGLTDETRCELFLLLGEAEIRAGNGAAAKKAFLHAADIARRLGLRRELARAAAGYGGRHFWGRASEDDRLVPLLEEGLAALGEEDVELQVRLLARLAGALRDEHSRDRRDKLSREAVELARQVGNSTALAYALDGRIAAILAPDALEERVALATELCELGEQIGDKERELNGHLYRWVASFEVGDIPETERYLHTAGRIADELRQPAQFWLVLSSGAMVALASGRLAEAEELAAKAYAWGERAHPGMAMTAYGLQQYTLCEFRGTFGEVESLIAELATEYPSRPVFRCALAHLRALQGPTEKARAQLRDLARDDFRALPLDMEWLVGLSLLAEVCALLSEVEAATELYELLFPWAAFNAVDTPEAVRGSVSRYLGLLASTVERWDEAARHFDDALEMNERMGARPWLAYTQEDYGRMLLERGDEERGRPLVDQALATYRELGMEGPLRRARSG